MTTTATPHTTLIVDGKTLLNDPLDTWQNTPPEQLMALMNQKTTAKPWIKAAMITVVDALLAGSTVNITITTDTAGWTMNVDNP